MAAVFLLMAIGTSLFFGIDSPARAAVINWFREVHETGVIYRFSETENNTVLLIYRLTWLPTDMEMADLYEDIDFRSCFYTDKTGECSLLFEYFRMESEAQLELVADADAYIYEQTNVNGNLAGYYQAIRDSDTNVLVWTDEKREIVFHISTPLEKSVIINIAELVVLE